MQQHQRWASSVGDKLDKQASFNDAMVSSHNEICNYLSSLAKELGRELEPLPDAVRMAPQGMEWLRKTPLF